MLDAENETENGLEMIVKSKDSEGKSTRRTKTFSQRLRKDGVYRRKFVLTLAVFWSYVTLGWVVLQIGTALPDLQYLVNIDLETASWLFTTWSLGFLTGSLFCGFLYDRVNRLVTMFASTLGIAVCSACLPYSKTLTVMISLRVLTGIFCGGVDTGANTIVPSIWGSEGGPFMQALYLSYTFGSIASPLATEPFLYLAKGDNYSLTTIKDFNTMETNVSFTKATTDCYSCFHNKVIDTSTMLAENTSYERLLQSNISNLEIKSLTESNISSEDLTSMGAKSSIHVAFMITCGLVVSSAIPYLVMALIGNFDVKATSKSNENTVTKQETEPLREKGEETVTIEITTFRIEGKRKYAILACIAGVNLLYGATEDSLGSFIVTFALDYLAWSSSSSVLLISLYWIASCIGGLGGIVLVRLLRPARLLFVAHILWITSFFLSLLASHFRITVMIWIFIPTSGFFMILIIPAAISWTEENVCHVTGRVSSMFMIATGTGLAVNPKVIGYLMEEYSYVFLIFILSIESVICFVLYISGYILRNFRYTPAKDVNISIHT